MKYFEQLKYKHNQKTSLSQKQKPTRFLNLKRSNQQGYTTLLLQPLLPCLALQEMIVANCQDIFEDISHSFWFGFLLTYLDEKQVKVTETISKKIHMDWQHEMPCGSATFWYNIQCARLHLRAYPHQVAENDLCKSSMICFKWSVRFESSIQFNFAQKPMELQN